MKNPDADIGLEFEKWKKKESKPYVTIGYDSNPLLSDNTSTLQI
jgi:hypothetical protein